MTFIQECQVVENDFDSIASKWNITKYKWMTYNKCYTCVWFSYLIVLILICDIYLGLVIVFVVLFLIFIIW